VIEGHNARITCAQSQWWLGWSEVLYCNDKREKHFGFGCQQ